MSDAITFLDDSDPELTRAWRTFPDPVLENDGEQLQYMGSSRENGRWQHSFRHRANPLKNGDRTYDSVPAPDGWKPAVSHKSTGNEVMF